MTRESLCIEVTDAEYAVLMRLAEQQCCSIETATERLLRDAILRQALDLAAARLDAHEAALEGK